ncbi:MAG: hypothetical protein ABSF82_06780 [Candidatus Bathyarchaeia archaeon]
MHDPIEDETGDNVQFPLSLKVPPATSSSQFTLPVGVIGLPEGSVTVAVKAMLLPTMTADGLGDTEVVVVTKAATGLIIGIDTVGILKESTDRMTG